MYVIWDTEDNDYVKELRGYPAGILAFQKEEEAQDRAMEYYGYTIFGELKEDMLCEIREV